MKFVLICICLLNNLFSFSKEIKQLNTTTDLIKLTLYSTSSYLIANARIGSTNQQMGLILDTQRNYTSIMSDKCKTCQNIIPFDSSKSKSFNLLEENYTIEMYKQQMTGRLGSDIISLDGDLLLNSSEIVLVDEINDGRNFDLQGFIGLGFTSSKEKNIIYRLKESGKIKSAVYSLLISIDSTSAELHLGGYDQNLLNSTNSSITWTNISYTQNDNFSNWYIQADSVYLNDTLSGKNPKIILNSASNVIRLPSDFFFDNLSKIFDRRSQCQIMKNSLFRCKCNSDYQTVFPTFKFTIDKLNNQNITISPRDYIALDNSGIQSIDSAAYCVLFLSPNYENDYWMLGLNFMNDFYTVFDIENSKVGFFNVKYLSPDGIEDVLFLSMIIVVSSILFFSALLCVYKKLTTRPGNNQLLIQDYLR